MPTKILVPTDFSGYSDKALQQALDIAVEYKAKVYALHVVHERIQRALTDDYSDITITPRVLQKYEKSLVKEAKNKLRKQIGKFPQSKEVEVISEVTNGIPAEEILRVQEEKAIDLIVIASLGRTGIARYLIGGVARNVLKGAKCPVLLTK
ncbi:MAG: universal stress protein [Syntrophorhabdaceae bacterium]|jgi:nucleotide-binding universal stress UspA family protein|nr:universal stress protein [Syntrophorhabdaceae bacterium]